MNNTILIFDYSKPASIKMDELAKKQGKPTLEEFKKLIDDFLRNSNPKNVLK